MVCITDSPSLSVQSRYLRFCARGSIHTGTRRITGTALVTRTPERGANILSVCAPYRLETFEEIIKEGRKFGVFVTISSQRPNDISPTITSQAHNYFIHRLLNERDLKAIASAVSYIDRVTEESIPSLPTGTCIFSGIASQMRLKLNVKALPTDARPRSATRKFVDIVPWDW